MLKLVSIEALKVFFTNEIKQGSVLTAYESLQVWWHISSKRKSN